MDTDNIMKHINLTAKRILKYKPLELEDVKAELTELILLVIREQQSSSLAIFDKIKDTLYGTEDD